MRGAKWPFGVMALIALAISGLLALRWQSNLVLRPNWTLREGKSSSSRDCGMKTTG